MWYFNVCLKKIYKRQVEIEIKFKMDFNSSIERKFPAANTEAAPHVRKKTSGTQGRPTVNPIETLLSHTFYLSSTSSCLQDWELQLVWSMNTTAISLFRLVMCRDLRQSNWCKKRAGCWEERVRSALTICIENPVISVRIQKERFIPVEIFSEKRQYLRRTTFSPLLSKLRN